MTLADELALLERVRAHCREKRWFAGDYAPEYRVAFYNADGRAYLNDDLTYAATSLAQQDFLQAPVTEQVLQETEHRLGRALPTILRTVYTTVANGGFGPGYGLVGLPMLAKTLTVGQWRLAPRAEEHLAQHPQSCLYCEQEPSDLVTLTLVCCVAAPGMLMPGSHARRFAGLADRATSTTNSASVWCKRPTTHRQPSGVALSCCHSQPAQRWAKPQPTTPGSRAWSTWHSSRSS
jgi:hypothetical protein